MTVLAASVQFVQKSSANDNPDEDQNFLSRSSGPDQGNGGCKFQGRQAISHTFTHTLRYLHSVASSTSCCEQSESFQQRPEETPAVQVDESIDPRLEHKKLLEHYNQMNMNINSMPRKEFRKDNEMLNVLARRSQNAAAADAAMRPQARTTSSSSPSNVSNPPPTFQDVAALLSYTRHNGGPKIWTPESLAKKFGMKEKDVEVLVKYYNTYEVVGLEGGANGRMEGGWVEDTKELVKGRTRNNTYQIDA
ncbi:hypothetical protein DFS34DRAFT_685066 [Phlyctochytrium arcticum]|nr:hypothetical protein DFS34DRAFT_685066 [Phlyctochytrium arcticum]